MSETGEKRSVQLNRSLSTYYEHRLFMLYVADDYRDYLGRLCLGSGWREKDTNAEIMAWATVIAYRARLRAFDFARNLGQQRFSTDGTKFVDDSNAPTSVQLEPTGQMELAIQLAIEAIGRSYQIGKRIQEDPSHAQLAFDTLYYIAQLHATYGLAGMPQGLEVMGKPDRRWITVSKSGLHRFLREKANGDRGDVLPGSFPAASDVSILHLLFHRLLALLANPAAIVDETKKFALSLRVTGRPEDAALRIRWAELASMVRDEPLIEIAQGNDPNGSAVFRFLVDNLGTSDAEPPRVLDYLPLREEISQWGQFLTDMFGNAAQGQAAAASARRLDTAPPWPLVEQAINRTGHLEDLFRQMPPGVGLPELDPELKRWFDILTDTLRRTGVYAQAFGDALFRASVIALVLNSADPPADLRVARSPEDEEETNGRLATFRLYAISAYEFLGEGNELDARVSTEELSRFQYLSAIPSNGPEFWNAAFDPRTTNAIMGPLPLIPTPPPWHGAGPLANWVMMLRQRERDVENALVQSPRLPEDWRVRYWALWEFPGTNVDVRRVADPSNTSVNALDWLHATVNGGFPAIRVRLGRLSIADWTRLLLMPDCPPAAHRAGENALGLNRRELFSPFRLLRFRATRPVLVLVPLSRRSSAWTFLPDPARPALVWLPPDVLVDGAFMPGGAPGANEDPRGPRPSADLRSEFFRILRRAGPDFRVCLEAGAQNPFFEAPAIVFAFGAGVTTTFTGSRVSDPRNVADLARAVDALDAGAAGFWRLLSRWLARLDAAAGGPLARSLRRGRAFRSWVRRLSGSDESPPR